MTQGKLKTHEVGVNSLVGIKRKLYNDAVDTTVSIQGVHSLQNLHTINIH